MASGPDPLPTPPPRCPECGTALSVANIQVKPGEGRPLTCRIGVLFLFSWFVLVVTMSMGALMR
jgi:hypothetical protein